MSIMCISGDDFYVLSAAETRVELRKRLKLLQKELAVLEIVKKPIVLVTKAREAKAAGKAIGKVAADNLRHAKILIGKARAKLEKIGVARPVITLKRIETVKKQIASVEKRLAAPVQRAPAKKDPKTPVKKTPTKKPVQKKEPQVLPPMTTKVATKFADRMLKNRRKKTLRGTVTHKGAKHANTVE